MALKRIPSEQHSFFPALALKEGTAFLLSRRHEQSQVWPEIKGQMMSVAYVYRQGATVLTVK